MSKTLGKSPEGPYSGAAGGPSSDPSRCGTTNRVTVSALEAEAVLAGYRVTGLLGRGGMGFVYEAEHLLLKRKAALKTLAPELGGGADFRERFIRESQTVASIDHPNIIPIYDAGDHDGHRLHRHALREGARPREADQGGRDARSARGARRSSSRSRARSTPPTRARSSTAT